MATQAGGRSRVWGAARTAWDSVSGSLGRVLRQLWLEVTGFVFLILAMIGGFALVREYAKYRAGTVGAGKLALAAGFTALFVWFGVSSFWRSRKSPAKR